MSRDIPKELYDQVFHLVDDIVQPSAPADEADEEKAFAALSELRSLFDRRESAGDSDPFLTEAMADFTEDDLEAARLYQLALEQCDLTPDEPRHTKHLGLAERLNAIGRTSEAEFHLQHARRGAFREGETQWMSAMDELTLQLRADKSSEADA